MRILVTGCAGFLGSHVADYCLSRGDTVYGIDDLSMGSMRNVDARVKFFGSKIDAVNLDQVAHCDYIYHLAGRVGVGQVCRDPLQMLIEHIDDTNRLCRQALKWDATILIPSTSEVYGPMSTLTDVPLVEDLALTVGPTQWSRSGYAVSKLASEHIALAYHKQHGVKCIVARFFNVGGPRQRVKEGCVVPTFVGQAFRGEPLTVFGRGNDSRCFAHVFDVVRALVDIMQNPDANGEIVNIGQGRVETTAMDLAKMVNMAMVLRLNTYPVPIRCVNYDELDDNEMRGFLPTRRPDTTKLDTLIGRQLPAAIENIVDDMCDWYIEVNVAKWRRKNSTDASLGQTSIPRNGAMQ